MKTYGYLRYRQENPNFNLYMKTLGDANCDEIFVDQFTQNSKFTPQLDKLLERIESGDKLATCDLVSLSRDIKVMARVMNTTKAKGASLVTLNDGSDFQSPEGVLGPFVKRLAIDYAKLTEFKMTKEFETTE